MTSATAPLFRGLTLRQLAQLYNWTVQPAKMVRGFKDRPTAFARVVKVLGRTAEDTTEEMLSAQYEEKARLQALVAGAEAKVVSDLPELDAFFQPEPKEEKAGPWADEHDDETPAQRRKRLKAEGKPELQEMLNDNLNKENEMATKTKTKSAKTKTARKVRAPGTAKRSYSIIPPDTKIRVLEKEPYRAGSEAAKRWAKFMDVPAGQRTYQTMRDVKLGGGHVGRLLKNKIIEKA